MWNKLMEELIAKICIEQNQRPLETNTRLTLASLGEQVAFDILWRISGQEIRKSFDGFVVHLAKQVSPNINASSPTIHSSLSPSPQQPQNRSPITPTRLLMNSQSSGDREEVSQQLVALGELEFRKGFLILSYLGGKNLEEVLSADQIRGFKDLSMRELESRMWFKGPYLSKQRNVLQRTLGEDNILMRRDSCWFGVVLAFLCLKMEAKKKDPTTSPVKYCFIRMESVALIDNQDNISCGKTIRQARSLFMHVDNLSSLSNYMARFSLILSKTMNLEVDLSDVDIKTISDVPCQDKDGNVVYGIDGKPLIHTDGTRFISHDLALKCPKNLFKELASELPILRFVAMSLISL
ncbi:hypothetical protein OIU78_002840 [Salix suchowensis]|nr:hypothetical protein OIU78_002840 [Salix suchowensis]